MLSHSTPRPLELITMVTPISNFSGYELPRGSVIIASEREVQDGVARVAKEVLTWGGDVFPARG